MINTQDCSYINYSGIISEFLAWFQAISAYERIITKSSRAQPYTCKLFKMLPLVELFNISNFILKWESCCSCPISVDLTTEVY